MYRHAFLLGIDEGRASDAMMTVRNMAADFDQACKACSCGNFSIWRMAEYLFGYMESETETVPEFARVFEKLPAYIRVLCLPDTMRQMYHDIGIVREDKSVIRHRVFATRLHEGCAEEYKRRHDGLIEARGDIVKEGPESNFTIWYGDGCIFGYCELVRSFVDGHVETAEEHAATVAWETRGLEIMDWITDDVDWLTGLRHDPVEKVL